MEIIREDVDIATTLPLNSKGYLMDDEWVKFDRFGSCSQAMVEAESYHGSVRVWVRPFVYESETRRIYFIKDIDVTIKIHIKEKELTHGSGSISHNILIKPKGTGEADLNVLPYN
ncbi:MAG: hypothetical protein K2H76_09780 [Muribaculaceae bacterium]|nr:hypothetical protein [Muribaculaceae bacterium]